MGKTIEKIGKKASKKENGENDYLKEYDKAEHLADWGFTGDYCHHCGIKNSEISGLLMQCGRCKQAYYCSTKCFNEALPVHRQTCDTEAWTRDPKGTKMERTNRSQTKEDRAPKVYEENNRIKKDKKKIKDNDKQNMKSDLSFPNRKYENNSMTPKSTKQSTKNSTGNSLYDDTENEDTDNIGSFKNSYSPTKNSENEKKKEKKQSLADYDDDDTEESATVTTEHDDDVEEIGDEITEAVLKARQVNPYRRNEFDPDDDEELDSESEDESSSDFDDGHKKKNKGRISTSCNDSSEDESEDDKNATNIKSKKSVRYGSVSLDHEFEDEFEVVTDVSVTSTSYVISQESAKTKFETDCTPIDGIQEEAYIVATGNQSQKEENNQQTKIRKEYERGVTAGVGNPEKSPKWPGGKLLPKQTSAEKKEIRLRRLSQQERKEHKWDRPDWVNPSLRPVSVNRNDGNDSFSADDILAIASDEELGSENSAHNILSLGDVNQSSQSDQIDHENYAGNQGANHDNKILDQRHLQKSVGNIQPSRYISSEREARRSGRGRLAYHRSFIDDNYDGKEEARNLRTGNGVFNSEISEEEAIKLRRVEAQQKKEYNWEQPEWAASRDGRLGRSRSAEEPSLNESRNFEHDTPDFNTSIANLRHVNESERQRPEKVWTKPDWTHNKPIGRRCGNAESSSALYFERDENNGVDKELYQSFSAFNYTPRPPEAILMTKEELRKAETIRNKQYGWQKPDWACKSPLKKSSKLWKPATGSNELTPIEIVASGRVEHKKLEGSKNNSSPQTVSKESIHVQKSTHKRQMPMAIKDFSSDNTKLHSTDAKQQSNTSTKKYYYEEDNLYATTTVSVEKEPVTLLESTKKYQYDEETIYSMDKPS